MAGNGAREAQNIVLLDAVPEHRANKLRVLLPAGFQLTHATTTGEDHLCSLIQNADYALCGQVRVSGKVLRSATRLKLLHKWGVGVDGIDLETAQRLNIKVARTTGSNALSVAEFTLGLMLSALRAIPYGHHKLAQGEWHGPNVLPFQPLLLSGKTVGLVGFGAIGTEVAKLLRGFGCRILYTKRERLLVEDEKKYGIEFANLADILALCDVVSLHCPLTPETTGLINAAALASMKSTAVLVNVARGGVVVESDLHHALSRRVIQAAAMDVFSVEPLPANSALLKLDNLVLTPHLAAVTADTFEPTVRRMFENIRLVSMGQLIPAQDVVV
jgi:phosphoglycerate dehydrogenase-like enzyme